MIYEHAKFVVTPGREKEFEAAYLSVRETLESAPGCESAELIRSVDRPATFLLRVGWQQLADHTEVFPRTPQAKKMGLVLKEFLAERVDVVHYESVAV